MLWGGYLRVGGRAVVSQMLKLGKGFFNRRPWNLEVVPAAIWVVVKIMFFLGSPKY